MSCEPTCIQPPVIGCSSNAPPPLVTTGNKVVHKLSVVGDTTESLHPTCLPKVLCSDLHIGHVVELVRTIVILQTAGRDSVTHQGVTYGPNLFSDFSLKELILT